MNSLAAQAAPTDNSPDRPDTVAYRGRFAPSPTGPLHMGSLLAAVASYLEARRHRGEWLLRIEDIDPPREIPGSSDLIIKTLDAFGFQWDGEIVYQHQRLNLYRDVLHSLKKRDLVYPCICSRKDVRRAIKHARGLDNIYPGTCCDYIYDDAEQSDCESINWRLRTHHHEVEFNDQLQGTQRVRFQIDQGDFVVWRKDDLPRYQLAVTVDDHAQGITHIVRGIDLLQESAGQHLLRSYLEYPQPVLTHVPMLVGADGAKLSKQTGALGLDSANASQHLCTALELLGIEPHAALRSATIDEIWQWAFSHWHSNALLNKKILTMPQISG